MNGKEMLQAVRDRLPALEFPSAPVRLSPLTKTAWLVSCGRKKFDPIQKNGAMAKKTGLWLNFQINGNGSSITRYEIWLAFPGPEEWQIGYACDPANAASTHPPHHIQFSAATSAPYKDGAPFKNWRLPYGETAPEKILEFLVAQAID